MTSDHRTYRIHHLCFSQKHKFKIDDGTDKVLYNIGSLGLPLFESLLLSDASTDKRLMKICEENIHVHRKYDISAIDDNDSKEQHLATVMKLHSQHHFENIFEIQSTYGVYQAKCGGAIQGHEFQLTKGNETVAAVTKASESPKLGYTYHVDISNDEGGDLFLLSIIIAVWHAQRLHPI